MTEGTSPPRPPLLRATPPRHELPAQPDRSAHRRIDKTNRSLWQQIREVNTCFMLITSLVIIGGILIAVIGL